MHLLMTTDTLGGVFSYATSLASWLSSQGVRVTLASMGGPLSPEQRAAVEQSRARLEESSYRLEWMEDPWADVRRAGEWLLTLDRELRPDMVHLNGYAHATLAWRAPVCVVAHSCVCSWFRAVRGEAAPEGWGKYRELVARALAAAHVIAPTRAMLEMLRREYGRPRQGEVIWNGMLLPAAGDAPPKEPVVLAAGRVWDAAKNMAALNAAAASVPWPICVAGEALGPGAKESIALPQLELLGVLARDALALWMNRAAIFAAPALYEPFGLAILEAATRGCALVLGDIPTLRELWSGSALFVDPRDPAALAAALNQLIGDRALCAELGRRAQRRAQAYGLRRMGKAYLRAYRSSGTARAASRLPELSP